MWNQFSMNQVTHQFYEFCNGDILNIVDIRGIIVREDKLSGQYRVEFLFSSGAPLSCGYFSKEEALKLQKNLKEGLYKALEFARQVQKK